MAKNQHCDAFDCPWPPNTYVRFNKNLGGYFVQDGKDAQNTHCWPHAQDVADRLNQDMAPQEMTNTGQMALFD